MRISREEYAQRMTAVQQRVAAAGVDAFLIGSKDSIFYLTGVSYEPLERPFFILMRPSRPAELLVPAMEVTHLQAAPNIESVQQYWEYPAPAGQGWPERLRELLTGIRNLAIEPALPQEIAGELAEFAVVVRPFVDQERLIKSPAEVAMLRLAAKYADRAVERVIAASYYGVAEIELFSQGREVQIQIMKEVGYDVLTTDVLAGAWPAPLSAQPHGIPTIGDRLREGPHIAVCLDHIFGYAAECERTYFTAPPTPQMQQAFAAMREARRRAYAMIKPGVEAAAVDAAANDFLRAEGYGDNLLHRTGHGFGLGSHEGPWLAEGSGDVLAENMVVSNEPGIYLPGVGGFRHSDTILVTADGYENLTRYPTDLAALTVLARKPLKRLRGMLVRRAVGVS